MSIDRRDFLMSATALAALSAGWDGLAFARAPRSIKRAVKIGMVKTGGSLEDRFRVLKEIGYDGVEVNAPSELTVEEVKAASAATGLAVPGVVGSAHWSHPLSANDAETRDRGREALEEALRFAAAIGADTVLLVPAVVTAEVSYDAAYERSQAEIRRVLPLAESLEVRIAFENVWNQFLLSPIEAARYVDEFKSDAVGWYFDVGNVVNYGWPEQWVRILGSRILKLDIKEYSRTKRDQEGLWKGFQVKLLEGDCNWPAVMQAIDEIGFTGWATAEVGGGDAERLADILDRMDRIFAS